jgi:hypothetical protein
MFMTKKQKCVLTFVTLFFVASVLSYAITFDEIRGKVEAKIDQLGKLILKVAHPTSTYTSTELYGFEPYYSTQTGYDAKSNQYDYNLKVVFKIQYKGWAMHHTMKVAVYLNYLMPKDIRLEADTSSFQVFGIESARKMIANFKSEFN